MALFVDGTLANSNQTKRILGAATYLLFYDAKNRLWKVCKDTSNNGSCETSEEIAQLIYNGDGKRVKNVMGSQTTLYASPTFARLS